MDVSGRFPRIGALQDEVWRPTCELPSPDELLRVIRRHRPTVDIATFGQRLPDVKARYPYPSDRDNIAVADTTDFERWWTGLPQETRKNVRRSAKRGLLARPVEFSDDLVAGIKRIYDETPIRQGRLFPHYRKPPDLVRAENGTYLDRAVFVGAFVQDTLVGFLKMVRVDSTARIMQIISLDAHADKRPTNALLAKAIEICAAESLTHLIYGQFVYGKKENSPVTEFKRRNGFFRVDLPRYYVPLTLRGRVLLTLGLHRTMKDILPESLVTPMLRMRARIYDMRRVAPTRIEADAENGGT